MRSILAFVLALASWPLIIQGLDEKRHRAECKMWSKLEQQTINLQNNGHANCTTNPECTGFTCDGKYLNKDLSFGMRVLPCSNPPGVEIFGYAPQINPTNFSHIFTHEDQYDIPGVLLNQGLAGTGDGLDMIGKLEVHIKRNAEGRSLMLGLLAKGCVKGTQPASCPFKKSVFNHTQIPVPECTPELESDIPVNTQCTLNDLGGCGANQVCVQSQSGENEGQCLCRPGFIRHTDRTCISAAKDESLHPSKPSSSQPRVSQPSASDETTDEADASSSGTVAVGVFCALLVVLVVAGGVFFVFRTRFGPRLRARLTNTPYSGVIIGQNGRAESQQNVMA